MRKNFLVTFLSVYLISCNENPVSTQINTIEGGVSDAETGSVLSGVTISTDPTTEQTNTNGEGQFVIDLDVKPGERYRVNASKQGYIPNFAELTTRTGKNPLTSDIVLHKEKPSLGVSPTTLDFGISKNSLPLTIENIGGKLREFTWVMNIPNEPWITANKTTGHITNQTEVVNISVNRTGLSIGNYNTRIVVTADNDAGSKSIDVIMTVPNLNAPQMSVNKVNIDFGDSQITADVQVSNSGTGVLKWQVTSSDPNWLSISRSSDSCRSNETKAFNIIVNRTNLAQGPYDGNIFLTSNGAGNTNTHTIYVKALATTSPVLFVTPTILDFGEMETQMAMAINNQGGGTLNWTLTADKAWISLNRLSGRNDASIGVTIGRNGLSAGPYNGIIKVQTNAGEKEVTVIMKNTVELPSDEKEPNNDITQANEIRPIDIVAGGIGVDKDTEDWFKIPILKNGRLWFTIINNNSGANTGSVATTPLYEKVSLEPNEISSATVYHSGNRYYIGPGESATSPKASVSKNQVYYLKVPQFSNHSASYRIDIKYEEEQANDYHEPNNSVNEPTIIQEKDDFRALIGFEDDPQDWYQISFTSNGLFEYKLSNLNPSTVINGYIARCPFYLSNRLSPIELTSISNYHSGNRYDIRPGEVAISSQIAVSYAKDYYIYIPKYENHAASYRLQTGFIKLAATDIGEPNDSAGLASVINENGLLVGLIGYQNDNQDWYKIVMPANGTFQFSLTNQHASGVNSGRIATTSLYDATLKQIATITNYHTGNAYYIGPGETAISTAQGIPIIGSATYFINIPKYGNDAAPYQIQTNFVRN